jgi:hypothetical protein
MDMRTGKHVLSVNMQQYGGLPNTINIMNMKTGKRVLSIPVKQ